MTLHLGNIPAGITLYIPFASYGADGQSLTLTGLAATDIEIYKNGSVTQRSSDAGYTLLDTDGIDFDGLTGIHGFSIDLNDNTDSGFFSVGGWYWVVVSAVTINAQTVSFVAATFRIVAAEATAGYPVATLKVGTGTGEINLSSGVAPANVTQFGGSNGTFSSGRPEVNTTHAAGTAWGSGAITSGAFASGAITAGAIAADAIGASELAADAASEIGTAVWATATRQLTSAQTFNLTGDITGNLSGSVGSVTGAVGSVTGAVGSVTGAVGSVTGAVGSVTGNVGGNVTGSVGSLATQAKADVNAEVLDVLRTDTGTELSAVPAAAASIGAQIQFLYQALRNKRDTTSSADEIHNDAGTVVATATLSDDGTTFTKGEYA